MRMDYLKIFVDLAETLNFTQTSQNMNLTQPSISQIIKSLETELGVVLFRRTKRKVDLTESGQAFYEDMKPLLIKYELSIERVKDLHVRKNNSFTIGYTGTFFEAGYVPQIIRMFNEKFPNVQLYLMNFNHNILKKRLLSRDCDVIFQTADSVEHIPDIAFKHLLSGKFVCVVPSNHPLSGRERISFQDLERENIILLNDSLCPPRQTEIQKILKERCRHSTFCYSDSIMISHTMIQACLGVSVFPDFVTDYSTAAQDKDNKFVVIPFDYDVELSYGLAYLAHSKSRLVEQFAKYATTVVQ